ncbi:hypothetical protein IE81DRAFT_325443 [Ceraceosorus guamensis]|uniref:Uncharacterized protein n=1 Tax=Ceraceosorus guamensis TaxID=1522189 RepID=A0A316VVW3_9BASI|nr:hypothetical protein IE81DRAFT_325443 [Ceraceosorus guamensis]PWN40573.1 hypothetical protein IE81DRAFT_325443 [Ceraceosorus guamensis]
MHAASRYVSSSNFVDNHSTFAAKPAAHSKTTHIQSHDPCRNRIDMLSTAAPSMQIATAPGEPFSSSVFFSPRSSTSAHPLYGSIRHPNDSQITTMWALPICFAVILIAGNLKGLAILMYPFKMWANLTHEMFHVMAAILSGGTVHSIAIDPERGAISGMTGGNPVLTLAAGYFGSTLFGAALIFCSFDIRASKIAYLATVAIWIPVAWFGLTWCVVRAVMHASAWLWQWAASNRRCL